MGHQLIGPGKEWGEMSTGRKTQGHVSYENYKEKMMSKKERFHQNHTINSVLAEIPLDYGNIFGHC